MNGHVMRMKMLKHPLVDQELSAKLDSELQMEKEMRDSEKLPINIQDFLDNSSFEVRFYRHRSRS